MLLSNFIQKLFSATLRARRVNAATTQRAAPKRFTPAPRPQRDTRVPRAFLQQASVKNTNMVDELDVEAFIQAIEKHPEIWDVNCEDNRFKMRKQRAWIEIARTFVEDYDMMSEVDKLDIFRKLHGKWRNIRDTFVRYKRRSLPGRRSYIYMNSLTFLNSVYKFNSGSEAEVENDSNSNQQLNYSSDDDARMKHKRSQSKVLNESNWSDEEIPSTIDNLKRKRVPNVKTEAVEFVETPFADNFSTIAAEDDDRSFFESLLPAVRQFDLDQKLEFRSQVLNVLQNIRLCNNLSKTKANNTDS